MDFEPSAEPSSTSPLQAPRPEGILHKAFLNDKGLRGGWRLLIYAAFVAALGFGGLIVLQQFAGPTGGVFSPGYWFAYEVFCFTVVFTAALIMGQIEGHVPGAYGLPRKGAFGKLFWQGYLIGLVEVSVLIGLIAAFGGYSFGDVVLNGRELLCWGMLWAVLFVFVGLFEEFSFRGYTQFTLADTGFWPAAISFSVLFWRFHLSNRADGIGFWLAAIWLSLIFGRVRFSSQGENTKGIGFWPAAILLSLLFGRVHLSNPGESRVGVAGVVMIGLIFAFALRRTGNLWVAVGWHASFDFGETFLYSVPNSGAVFQGHLSNASLHGPNWLTGGSAGPEGSVFSFLTMGILAVAIHFLFPAKKPEPAQVQ